MTRVYVAGSSAELNRVEHWTARLIAAGITVTSTWPANVRAVGSANPRDATREQRAAWAMTCLRQVATAQLVWFLVPAVTAPTRGAWIEVGFMRGLVHGVTRAVCIISSGDTLQSIFCALGDEHETDEAAFAAIVGRR